MKSFHGPMGVLIGMAHCLLAGAELKPRTGLKPFTYVDSQDRIPNYVPSDKWGVQGAPARKMQAPLSAEESLKHVVVPEGLQARLFASEPDIAKPITMAWDARGRLWIAETLDYPNEQQPDGQGRDRIKICEDTNGDGRADSFVVFAEKLSIPTGMVFAQGGLIVVEGGHTLILRDLDGDDRADERRILFSGWDMGDTHATASNLRYGFDNWIWGSVGYSGFKGEVGGKLIQFGMGVFRFKPDGSQLEFIRSSNNNTWGLGLSEEGIVFGSTANNNPSWYMPIPNRYYESVVGWSPSRMETIADSQQIHPITRNVRQVDWHDRYTAGAGHALYTARTLPESYWNQVAFVTEPTGHLVGQFRLKGSGADFSSHNEGNFMASDDEWCAPIAAEIGPDGGVWVVDWYNYIVQHNPVPHGFENGRGNAYETKLRDKRHGRIFRVVPESAPRAITRPAIPRQPSTGSLLAVLKDDNLLWRLHAQRLLVERGDKSVAPDLLKLLADTTVESLGLNPGALHSIWTLAGLGLLSDPGVIRALNEATRHPSPPVRRAVAMSTPRDSRHLAIFSRLLDDRDAQVRLAAMLAMSELPTIPDAGSIIARALRQSGNQRDRWLQDALISAASMHPQSFFESLADWRDRFDPANLEQINRIVRTVSHHWAASGTDEIPKKLPALAASTAGIAFLDGVLSGWPAGKSVPAGTGSDWQKSFTSMNEETQAALAALAIRWGVQSSLQGEFPRLIRTFKTRVLQPTLPNSSRIDAARRLIALDDSADSVATLADAVDLRTEPEFATGIYQALGTSRLPGAAPAVLGRWPQLTPSSRRAAIGALLRRPEWCSAIMDAIESAKLPPADIGRDQWNQIRNHRLPEISDRARRLDSMKPAATSAELDALIKELIPVVTNPSDAKRGAAVFETSCRICHVLNGKGAKIGPDLTGMGTRPKSDLLVEVLDPNRSVESNYRLWNVTKTDGDTLSGRLDGESASAIEITDTTGQKHVVQRSEIERLEVTSQSIMPGGFEKLSKEDLAGLLEFLADSVRTPK